MPFIDPDENNAVSTNELNFGGLAWPLANTKATIKRIHHHENKEDNIPKGTRRLKVYLENFEKRFFEFNKYIRTKKLIYKGILFILTKNFYQII